MPSRPHLRMAAAATGLQLNVQIVRRLVAEPLAQAAAAIVLLDSPGSGQDRERKEFIAADLIVDAAGRGRGCRFGYDAVGVGEPAGTPWTSASATYQPPISHSRRADRRVVAGASHDQSGARHAPKDGTWVSHTTFGVADATADFRRRCVLADKHCAVLHRRALAPNAIGCPAFHAFPSRQMASLRQAGRFPRGISVPFGDGWPASILRVGA